MGHTAMIGTLTMWSSGHTITLVNVGIKPLKAWHDITINGLFQFSFVYPIYALCMLSIQVWHLLHSTLLWCIKSYMENPNYEFLTSRWFVYSWLMDFDNPFEIVIYYLLIREIIGLGHRDRIPMISTLVCMVIIRQDLWSHMIGYQIVITSPSYYIVWVFNLENVLTLC